jgi:hypothetical protein
MQPIRRNTDVGKKRKLINNFSVITSGYNSAWQSTRPGSAESLVRTQLSRFILFCVPVTQLDPECRASTPEVEGSSPSGHFMTCGTISVEVAR